jgi:hypothetical protein
LRASLRSITHAASRRTTCAACAMRAVSTATE